MLKPYQKLAQYWATTDAGVVTTAVSEAKVVALEAKYGVQFPPDFREYLRSICPANESDALDHECTDWWSLDRITSVRAECNYPVKNKELWGNEDKYIIFADGYIWCWAWAISCSDDENRGRIAIIGLDDDRFVASSFQEFIDLYIQDYYSVC
jgi:hypothetical protein